MVAENGPFEVSTVTDRPRRCRHGRRSAVGLYTTDRYRILTAEIEIDIVKYYGALGTQIIARIGRRKVILLKKIR